MNSNRPRVRVAAGVILVGALVGLSGCRVDTNVSVVDRGGGQGTVRVTAVFDGQAVSALGGESGLARQLSVSDLRSDGWQVDGPVPAPAGGGATITVSHGFSSSTAAQALLAEVAGTGPAADRPFKLSIATHRGFFHVEDRLSGTVDLRCELACFGDQGLQSALGNPNGVATAPLLAKAGERPDQVFGFSLSATMPGKLQSNDAVTRSRSTLTWPAPLGQVTEISADSESLNTGNIVLVAVVGGVVIAGGITGLFFRRRGRRAKHALRRRVWSAVRRKGGSRAKADS